MVAERRSAGGTVREHGDDRDARRGAADIATQARRAGAGVGVGAGTMIPCVWCCRGFRLRRDGGCAQRFCGIRCRRALDAGLRAWTLAELAAGRMTVLDIPDASPQRRQLSRLDRAVSGADPQRRRYCRHGQSRQSQVPSGAPLIRAAGAKLFFLPRDDLNPIEQVFAKLNTLLRKTDPRTIEATWRNIGDLLDRFSPRECANYLANAGYASA